MARAAPDGYTLLSAASGPLTVLPHLQKHIAYDPLRDFAPIGQIASAPQLLVAHPSAPFTTIKELIALAKAKPGALNYASSGNGSANHLTMELFKSMAGVNITHVPYSGQPQALTDVLGGRVPLTFNAIPPVLPLAKAGRLRVLGITTSKRSPLLLDVPSINEAGVPGYEGGNWYGLFAPAKTPRPIIDRLNNVLVKIVLAPDIKSQFATQGADPVGSSPEQFAVFLRQVFERNGKVVKLSGMKVD